jgi:hypothetical protein
VLDTFQVDPEQPLATHCFASNSNRLPREIEVGFLAIEFSIAALLNALHLGTAHHLRRTVPTDTGLDSRIGRDEWRRNGRREAMKLATQQKLRDAI